MHKKHHEQKETEMKEDVIADNVSSENTETAIESEKLADEQINVDGNEITISADDFEAKYKETYDKLIRQAAEYDNFRKRTLKEKADLLKYGGESTLKNLIPVIDDLEIAVKVIDKSEDIAAIKEGFQLIVLKFNEYLKQNGVKEIEALNKDFDVDVHEAITKIPSEDKKGKVVDVLQKGYFLNDKVVRYSKVVVGE